VAVATVRNLAQGRTCLFGASHRAGAKLAANTGAVGHQLRTSCRSVAHIGDSTSVGMVSAGYAARARLIARALAQAFPATGPSAGCLIR